MATLKEAVSTLLKNGAKRVDNLVVNNVTVTECDSYTRIALTLDKAVEGYVRNDDGSYTKGETNVIFVSLYSIASVLRENEELAVVVNNVITNPASLQVLLSHAKIGVIQEPVVAGEVRTNPFTEKEDEHAIDHDAIFNHVIDVKISKIGEMGLMKMIDKMLGII